MLTNGNTIIISQILSLTIHWNKAVNNILIAKTVEYACSLGVSFIVYARFGNHPSLDQFKYSNGFQKFNVGRFSGLKDFMPNFLIPIYNKASCLKLTMKKNASNKNDLTNPNSLEKNINQKSLNIKTEIKI